MKKLALLLLCLLLLIACAPAITQPEAKGEDMENTIDVNKPVYVEIEIEGFGTLSGELFPKDAPISVENFAKLANEGFYEGKNIHRIVEGFVLQGGSISGDGRGNAGFSIKGEFAENGVDNPLKHVRGALSMARTMDPNSASTQFFIVLTERPDLDGKYAAFGMIDQGMDIADKIVTDVPRNGQTPIDPVIIKCVKVWQ